MSSPVKNNLVCLDTSVWIEFFNGRPGSHQTIQRVGELLDEDRVVLLAPVKLEIFTGLKKTEAPRVTRAFLAFKEVVPNSEDYEQAAKSALLSREKGQTFSAIDLLIATVCKRREFLLWSLDRDFIQMEKLKWVDLIRS